MSAAERAVLEHALALIGAVVRVLGDEPTADGPLVWAWDAEREALVAHALPGGLRLGLEPDALQVVAIDARGRVCGELSLYDLTPAEALVRIVELVREFGLDASAAEVLVEDRPSVELPTGATFAPTDGATRARLAPLLALASQATPER